MYLNVREVEYRFLLFDFVIHFGANEKIVHFEINEKTVYFEPIRYLRQRTVLRRERGVPAEQALRVLPPRHLALHLVGHGLDVERPPRPDAWWDGARGTGTSLVQNRLFSH